MNVAANDGELDETLSIKLYMDLTGSSEACARNVYMFVSSEKDENDKKPNGLAKWRAEKSEVQNTIKQTSRARDESESDFGLGLLGNESLAITAK